MRRKPLDALGECGGPCEADADADGICDDVDPCVWRPDACGCATDQARSTSADARTSLRRCDCNENVLDECGICGGDGIPAGDCDCNGNQLDALGNCGGGCEADENNDGVCDTEIQGCTNELACNYNPSATFDDGSCTVNDECGICGGEGIPSGNCDCNGNQLDALGECGGSCVADADADGICDDVDLCVGELDACGVCKAQARPMNAVVRTSLRVTAIVTGTSSTSVASVEAMASQLGIVIAMQRSGRVWHLWRRWHPCWQP